MGVRMMDLLSGNLDALRYQPTAKRVRVSVAGEPVADTKIAAQLVPAGTESGDAATGFRLPDVSSRPVLDPSILLLLGAGRSW